MECIEKDVSRSGGWDRNALGEKAGGKEGRVRRLQIEGCHSLASRQGVSPI